jgi:hypothetical protein
MTYAEEELKLPNAICSAAASVGGRKKQSGRKAAFLVFIPLLAVSLSALLFIL